MHACAYLSFPPLWGPNKCPMRLSRMHSLASQVHEVERLLNLDLISTEPSKITTCLEPNGTLE